MMLFWILAITDLIMVGITWAVYGSSATYFWVLQSPLLFSGGLLWL